MKDSNRTGPSRAADLARAFDHAFAEPARPLADSAEGLLALRSGHEQLCARPAQMAGLVTRPNIVRLPSPLPELLGIAGVRGGLVPIFSLAALLGQPVPADAPSWLILVEAGGLLGLGFEELVGYVRVDRRDISRRDAGAGPTGAMGIKEAARVGEALRGIIDIASLVAALERRVS